MYEDLLYKIRMKISTMEMRDDKPELITMHPDTVDDIVNHNLLNVTGFHITGEVTLFGIKVARSLDVHTGEFFVA